MSDVVIVNRFKVLTHDIPLMGVAVSFFVRELAGKYVLEFEIFHA